MFLHFDLMMVTANKPGQNQDSDFKHVNLHAQKIINRLNHGKSTVQLIIGNRCSVYCVLYLKYMLILPDRFCLDCL